MKLAPFIDYTLLKPDCTAAQIDTHCKAAIIQGYRTVCIPPVYVARAAALLAGSAVGVCTVVGFPLGYDELAVKRVAAETSLAAGAQEIDAVINLSALKSGNYSYLQTEIAALRAATQGAILKIIVESGLFTVEELAPVLQLCSAAGVDFVKTSTGFAAVGAELDKVSYMRTHLPPHIQVKASGGIRTVEQALAFIQTGAARIGTSALLNTATN